MDQSGPDPTHPTKTSSHSAAPRPWQGIFGDRKHLCLRKSAYRLWIESQEVRAVTSRRDN
jgi:hypothetical protein